MSNINISSTQSGSVLPSSLSESGLLISQPLMTEKVTYTHYLPNLQGIRALAAIIVMISHIELHKNEGMTHLLPKSVYMAIGQLGVTVFFVLSGFLLTYLLISEKEKKQSVRLTHFYIRRILRIFPLFYLILFLGYFVMPHFYAENSESLTSQSFFLDAFFLTNVAFISGLMPIGISQLWSIGVEEQFYLWLPWLFKNKSNLKIVYSFLAIIVGFIIVRIVISKLCYLFPSESLNFIKKLIYFTRFDCMMLGGLSAWILANDQQRWYKTWIPYQFFTNRWTEITVYMLTIAMIILDFTQKMPINYQLFALFISIIILNLASNAKSLISLENKVFIFLGNISFGIYVWHTFIVLLLCNFISYYLGNASGWLQNVILYSGTFLLTLTIASLSYYGYEKHFLNLKKRFTT